MRITIEDSQGISNVNSAQLETNSIQGAIDAGEPTSSNNLQAANLQAASIGQTSHLEEAGSPPLWLLETISKAFAQDPGRFDAVSEPLDQVNNGGAAPLLKS
jgi:hypothetical protein